MEHWEPLTIHRFCNWLFQFFLFFFSLSFYYFCLSNLPLAIFLSPSARLSRFRMSLGGNDASYRLFRTAISVSAHLTRFRMSFGGNDASYCLFRTAISVSARLYRFRTSFGGNDASFRLFRKVVSASAHLSWFRRPLGGQRCVLSSLPHGHFRSPRSSLYRIRSFFAFFFAFSWLSLSPSLLDRML